MRILFYLLVSFTLGVTGTMLAYVKYNQPVRIICESGTFEPASDGEYLRERALCNIGDANGREIEVLVID
jgi:hypothetical protein